ncbi:acyltransferase [Desulfocarbo indianensis]|nr:acyltransferase [Desulfocarbo indianensis]
MLIASIQLSVIHGDKAANVDKAVQKIAQCGRADLVILPEIWNVGFMDFDSYVPQAETADGPTLSALRQAAQDAGVYLHTGSFVERQGDDYYNSSYLVSPSGELLANYRKIHLFGHNSRETQILTPGKEVVVVDTPLGRLGMATCYDLRFPELFRRMAEQGAQLFMICSAWPYPRLEHWIMLNRVRALENQCFLVSANSVGPQLAGTFVGHSMITGPWGTILASAGDDETIISTEIDFSDMESARERFSAFNDRVDWLR